jgi:hypothetical protein
VNEQTIVGLVTSVAFHKNLMDTGAFIPGDCVFSPQSGVVVSEMDKIIFTWPDVYGPGDSLERKYEDRDRLYYEGVTALVCIDEDRVRYTQGVDFRLNGKDIIWRWAGKDGAAGPWAASTAVEIGATCRPTVADGFRYLCTGVSGDAKTGATAPVWSTYAVGASITDNHVTWRKEQYSKAPATGKRYAIKYKAYIEWIVFVPPMTRRSHGRDMGNKVMLRKKHLMEG